MPEDRISLDGRQHREGIGKTGAFDDDAPERRQQPALASGVEVLERGGKLPTNRAADASGAQQDHLAVDALNKIVIQPDFAEFIDQNGRIGKGRVRQNALEQRRLAGAEKTRQKTDR